MDDGLSQGSARPRALALVHKICHTHSGGAVARGPDVSSHAVLQMCVCVCVRKAAVLKYRVLKCVFVVTCTFWGGGAGGRRPTGGGVSHGFNGGCKIVEADVLWRHGQGSCKMDGKKRCVCVRVCARSNTGDGCA